MADVANHATLTTDLLFYYEFEEASGTRVDAHNSYDLTDVNTVGQATGKVGNCASFNDANSEYFTSTFNGATEIGTGDFSFATWFKVSSQDVRRQFISFDVPGGWTKQFSVRAGRNSDGNDIRVVTDDGATGGSLATASGYQDGAWHFCVVTRVGTTVKLYVDNILKDTDVNSHNDMPLLADMRIGAIEGTVVTAYMDGELDQMGFWGKELSSTERSDLYNSGDGLVYDDGSGGGGSTFTPRVTTY